VKSIVITGGTGALGKVVVPRLQRVYDVILMGRGAPPPLDKPIYALVMLAGGFAMGNAWDEMIEANVMSAARAIDAVVPHLADGGRVVGISSMASLAPPAGIAAYAASKAALNAMIRSLASELGPRKITANALLPNTIDDALRVRIAVWISLLLSKQGDGVTGQLIEFRA
jgi:NAD(P)-dependent dehydrogenase (short-subunit alcohol dehydrogenase family)